MLVPRTLLFVSGAHPSRFDKAAGAGADGVILDLEDSVAAVDKGSARQDVAAWLTSGRAWVRTNPRGSAEQHDDVVATKASPGLLGYVVPKAESVEDLEPFEGHPVVALVESAAGVLGAAALARHPGVAQLAFGNLDFAADCGITVTAESEPELLPARMHLVTVSRAAGLPGPLDGVTTDVRDPTVAARDAARAARMGFTGKLCVHPSQVPPVREAFAPSAEEISWARRVLEGVADGVGTVDGAMVDRPVLLRARRVLDRA